MSSKFLAVTERRIGAEPPLAPGRRESRAHPFLSETTSLPFWVGMPGGQSDKAAYG